MTAKEMFEKLGYTYKYYSEAFGFIGHNYKWKQPCSGAIKEIMFWEISETVSIKNESDYGFNGKEIQAIAQQMKELGWIE